MRLWRTSWKIWRPAASTPAGACVAIAAPYARRLVAATTSRAILVSGDIERGRGE
jgi:hypothetical protein